MNIKDIARLAIEAGIPVEFDWAGRPSTLVIKDGGTYLRGIEDLQRFAALVAAAEREACAKECEEVDANPHVVLHHAVVCAASIRARGQ